MQRTREGLWVVPGSVALACPVAAAAGSPTNSASFAFMFPRAAFVHGVLALPRPSGVLSFPAQLAALGLIINDETNQPVVSDTRGGVQGSNQVQPAASLLSLHGKAFHPFDVQRPVIAGDVWRIMIQNRDPANAAVLAGLYFYYSEVLP